MAANAELQGKVGLDINPWMAALRRVRSSAEPAGAFIGRQFKSGFLRFFSAGAAIATVTKSLRDAVETRRGAAKLDLDVETYQALDHISRKTGHSIEDLTEKILRNKNATAEQKQELQGWIDDLKAANMIIDEATIERLADLSDKFERLFGMLAPLIAAAVDHIIGVIEVLKQVVKDAIGQFQALWNLIKTFDIAGLSKFALAIVTGKTPLMPGPGYLARLVEVYENALKVTPPKGRKITLPEREERQNLYKAQVDALQRVGGFIFGSPSQVMMGKQGQKLDKIEQRLIEIKAEIKGQLTQ